MKPDIYLGLSSPATDQPQLRARRIAGDQSEFTVALPAAEERFIQLYSDAYSLPFGVSPDYAPAIIVRGSRTFGRPTRIAGRKTSRVIQTLSTAETMGVLLAEFDPAVLGYFEQFPLPFDEYQTISSDLGRPVPGGDFSERLSVDLLVRLANHWVAVEIKRSRKDFDDPRVAHNLRCKKILLEAAGVRLVTFARDDLDPVFERNLPNFFAAAARVDRETLIAWARHFCNLATRAGHASIEELTEVLGADNPHQVLFKAAVWHHLIPLDLRQPVRFDRPPVLLSGVEGVKYPW